MSQYSAPNQESMPQTPPFSAMFDSSGYNRNLYQSAEDSCGGLYYHDNNLLSGSLEALIQHLVPNVDYYPDRTYIFTFLLSSRLFMHPYELMAKVCHLCVDHQRLSDSDGDKNQIRKIAPKILQLLTEWTETFPYDFRDERMMRNLKDLAHRIASGEEQTYRKNVQQMMQCLIRKLAALSQYEEVLAKISSTSTDRLTVLKTKPQSIQRDIITVCSDPYTLAQQLTHIELERLNYIGPEEFVQAFVQKDPLDNDKSCYSERKKTRNLEAYVEWFNRLSYLVATEICMHQMDPSSNFYNYRTALRGAAQRSLTAHSSREKIVIPFFSLLIKDIYFLNEGCANRLPNGHVNFEKFWELAKQVSEFMTWKQVECPFERDRKILQYLLTVPVFSEDALYLASYESEGPENHVEKDRWKSLSDVQPRKYCSEGRHDSILTCTLSHLRGRDIAFEATVDAEAVEPGEWVLPCSRPPQLQKLTETCVSESPHLLILLCDTDYCHPSASPGAVADLLPSRGTESILLPKGLRPEDIEPKDFHKYPFIPYTPTEHRHPRAGLHADS
ncbi:Ras-GEF domain-containing family member 1B [Tupaia chinensis]|uniref:Ras-GEF domain-containing family member 1B n=1 Tax=Tupaia chinensis TaxID=246437 RepID=L9KLR6_TUPCH|nr:Ras-GEF domain-containing family member 1B [Tupaia chinensis]